MPEPKDGQPIIEDDDGLNDLIDAELGPKDETPDETKSEEQPETTEQPETPEETPEEKPAETPEETPEEKPEEKTSEEETPEEASEDEVTFKYKGKQYKLSDLESDSKLREKILTGANQQTHYQQLHDENKRKLEEQAAIIEQLRQAELGRQQQTWQKAEADAAPKITPDFLTSSMKPAVEQMVKDGWVEEDANDLYPNAIAGVISMKQEFATRIDALENAVGRVLTESTTRQQTDVRQTVQGRLHGIFDELAAEGGIFSDLEKQETRDNFLIKVSNELNPELDSLLKDPSVLRKLWIANNADKMAEAAKLEYEKKLKAIEAEKTKTATQFAAGEGGGSSAPSIPSGDPTAAELEAAQAWGDL